MKLIGYWIYNLKDLSLPHPGELVGEMPADVRAAVCHYLSNGTYYNGYRGQSWCRFHCGAEHREMGHREFTDGEWIWPEGLVHYVRHHGIVLPDEFIAAATSGRSPAGLNVPQLMVLNSELLPYWIEWSAARRNPGYRERLAAAVERAIAEEPAFIEQRVAELRDEVGVGSDRCQFAGCSERALLGAVICARHALWNNGLDHLTIELYGGYPEY